MSGFKSVAVIAVIYFYYRCFTVTAQATTANIAPGNSVYAYYGCYNETTGDPSVGSKRALAGGSMVNPPVLPFTTCLLFHRLKPQTNSPTLSKNKIKLK